MNRARHIATLVSACVLLSVVDARAQQPDQGSVPLSTAVVWGEPTSGWQLGVALLNDEDPVTWGAPIRVRVYLKNVSEQSREVQHAPLFSLHRFQLRRVDEWRVTERRKERTHRETPPVPLTRYGRSLIEEHGIGPLKAATLKPDQSLVQELFLSRCFDLSRGGEHLLDIERLIPHGDALQLLKTPTVSIRVEPAGEIPNVTD